MQYAQIARVCNVAAAVCGFCGVEVVGKAKEANGDKAESVIVGFWEKVVAAGSTALCIRRTSPAVFAAAGTVGIAERFARMGGGLSRVVCAFCA